MKRILFLLTASIILISSNLGQSTEQKIYNYLETCNKNQQFNGNVLVSKNGKILFNKSYGYADILTKRKLKTSNPFRLASLSKQFTAMIIMLLCEEGKLKLEDKLLDYFPNLPYKGIKIHHLLGHTSGLPGVYTLFRDKWESNKADYSKRKTVYNDDVIKMLITYKPKIHFIPGEKFEYSNTGYMFLASIASKICKKSFNEIINEKIFNPLIMENSFAYDKKFVESHSTRAIAFADELTGDQIVDDVHFLDGIVGEGGIFSSTEDLFKYDQALRNGKLIELDKFLSYMKETKLNDGRTFYYNFGWVIEKSVTGKLKHWHSGSWSGIRTYFSRMIEEDYSIVVLANNSCNITTKIGVDIEKILSGIIFENPKPSAAREFAKYIKTDGAEKALMKMKVLYSTKKDKYDFSENGFNTLGYQYLHKKMYKNAITVFNANLLLYPKSANAYDSLGEVYLKINNKKKAIASYRQALKLNPQLESSKKMLRELGETINEVIKKEVKLDQKYLSQLKGKYKIGEGMYVEIKLIDGQVVAIPAGGEALYFKAESKTTFYSEEKNVQFSLKLNSKKEIEGLQIRLAGRDMYGKKIE